MSNCFNRLWPREKRLEAEALQIEMEAQLLDVKFPPFCPMVIGGICLRPITCAKCITENVDSNTKASTPQLQDPRPDCVKYDQSKAPHLSTPGPGRG